MKKCPFCAEEIKDDAIKCWHCGSNLISASPGTTSEPQKTIVVKNHEGAFLQTMNAGCIIVIVIIILIIGMVFIANVIELTI